MNQSYADEAIKLALQGRWEEAIEINRSIVELYPNDIDAYCRLGKALMETGNYTESKESYNEVLKLSPSNSIAKRNLERLTYLKEGEGSQKGSKGVDTKFFIEETSKARVITLSNIAPKEIRARLSTSDQVNLEVRDQQLIVVDESASVVPV